MSELEIRNRMGERLLAAQTPLGRIRLNFYVHWKRAAWNFATGFAFFLKRVFDIIVSLIALSLLAPVFIAIAIAVKLDGGPIFFRQTRFGLHGREFGMLKYRSMCVNAEGQLNELLARNEKKEGITFKIKDDPRVTRIGYWLRRYSLDELPQFYNVLIGDMSLVGPRPPVPREVALYSLADRRRLAVKPGITCVWQISGRAEIDFPAQVLLDVNYIESQSLGQDLRILAKTPKAVVFGSGAY